MAKRKGTKEQTMIYKTLHRTPTIEQCESHIKQREGWTQMLWKGKRFLLHQ